MINFRRLKQDFPPAILKDGRLLYDKKMVSTVKIVSLSSDSVRLSCSVMGNYENHYESEIEINRRESVINDSDCDCPYKYDCQHLAAVLFYLEENFDELLVNYSKETNLEKKEDFDEKEKEKLLKTFKEAETKEVVRKGKKQQQELLQEYILASKVLGQSPFFLSDHGAFQENVELAAIFTPPPLPKNPSCAHQYEIRLALRLPSRSKSLNVLNIKEFLESIRYHDAVYLSNKKYFFNLKSFNQESAEILKMIMNYASFTDCKGERNLSIGYLDSETFGTILAHAYEVGISRTPASGIKKEEEQEQFLACLYCNSIEEPLRFYHTPAALRFDLDYLEIPTPKLFLKPMIVLEEEKTVNLEEVALFESEKPGMLYNHVYYRFQAQIRRKHLRNIPAIRDVTIPEPLFGTFVENSLPELLQYAEVANQECIDRFVTMPYVGQVSAICDIGYLKGELEASLHFVYDDITVPSGAALLKHDHISAFATAHGILARNLTEEQRIIQDLFQDFHFDPVAGVFIAKTDKKIVEFMTETVPRNQHRVKFNPPKNLLEQFIYDNTEFALKLRETDRIDTYIVELKIKGHLEGLTIDLLWDCLASKRAFIELSSKKIAKNRKEVQQSQKILVLDLEKLNPIVQMFDELGINSLSNHAEERPLWSLASINPEQFERLSIKFSMSDKLFEIQQQMLGIIPVATSPVPAEINATLRSYQLEGVQWLERLRHMHLNGILADDMGLGKTIQAIIAITQSKQKNSKGISIVVCPTSLIHNWKEEFNKFNPSLKAFPVDGMPQQRKKLQSGLSGFDVVITSYSLLQKDIEFYKTIPFSYAILDEAQHIKNRATRNAKSVKMLQATHRLILTGTPIENSLHDLWSLFDFLMPGLLSSFDRFSEKYVRNSNQENLENLRRKVAPFIMRRMKEHVLTELPPVSEITYHCHLNAVQRELYRSYANSAREELSRLVKKEGYDNVQIQILATLTRLKQICCHPAIFAKEKVEEGDSAKYEMLMELLHTLIEGRHKTVIFSQYTRMLNIMREDLEKQGINFCYLDGSSKNRMSIVKRFNEDENILVFLVSLKAGGTGLNLVGANTVIHYDMWWNPAVEDQATNRVHRIGQKSSVSAYKLVTKDSIEEKIVEIQNRKKERGKKVISGDEEVISKLTWEEVLELLQT